MRKFFIISGSILYFALLWLALVFLFPKDYLLVWLSIGVFALFVWIPVFIRIIPSKRQRQYMKTLVHEFKEINRQEADLKSNANTLKMLCPACNANDNLYRFLQEGVCPSCKSGLWTTTLKEAGDQHRLLFSQKENLNAFYSRVSASKLRKLRIKALAGRT